MKKFAFHFKKDARVTLWVALGWQLLLLAIGFLIAPAQGLIGHLNHWDAGWYLHIIQFAYSSEGSPAAPAFYPLFPLIIGVLKLLTFSLIPTLFIAFVVNTIALWAALLALVRILTHFKSTKWGIIIGVVLFLSFPSAFFMHVFYSEAIFIALAFWAYYAALEKRWWLVGILLAVLTSARLPSLLFVALCGLEYLKSYDWKISKALNKNILWFLLAPLGFISYGLYLLITRGDFLAMFHAYSATNDWTYHTFNLNVFATLSETISTLATAVMQGTFNYEIFINYTLPLFCIILIIAASIYLLVRLGRAAIPLFVFGILCVVLFTVNSNVISVHRYALAGVVLYIAASLLSKEIILRGALIACCSFSFLVQLFLYSRFISNIFAG